MGTKPPKLENIIKHIGLRNSNISKHRRNSLWSFSLISELRIIIRRHADRRKCCQQSTDDRRLSITARWRLGVTQDSLGLHFAFDSFHIFRTDRQTDRQTDSGFAYKVAFKGH